MATVTAWINAIRGGKPVGATGKMSFSNYFAGAPQP